MVHVEFEADQVEAVMDVGVTPQKVMSTAEVDGGSEVQIGLRVGEGR